MFYLPCLGIILSPSSFDVACRVGACVGIRPVIDGSLSFPRLGNPPLSQSNVLTLAFHRLPQPEKTSLPIASNFTFRLCLLPSSCAGVVSNRQILSLTESEHLFDDSDVYGSGTMT